jgi:hypothetical protein
MSSKKRNVASENCVSRGGTNLKSRAGCAVGEEAEMGIKRTVEWVVELQEYPDIEVVAQPGGDVFIAQLADRILLSKEEITDLIEVLTEVRDGITK